MAATTIFMSIGYVHSIQGLAPIRCVLIRWKWCHRYILFLASAHVHRKQKYYFNLCVSLFASLTTVRTSKHRPQRKQSRVVGHSWFFYMINGAVCVRPLWILVDYLSLYGCKAFILPRNCTSRLLKTHCIKNILNFAPVLWMMAWYCEANHLTGAKLHIFFYK